MLVANHSQSVSISGWTDADGNVQAPITSNDVLESYTNLATGDEPKTGIEIDGVLYDKGEIGELTGAWSVEVLSGQTMTCNYDVIATPS
jgi:hypothetical protein